MAYLNLFNLLHGEGLLLDYQPNALNKIFMRLYEDVNHEKYLPSIQFALLNKKGNQRFPRNTEVLNALREKDMYGIKPKNIDSTF